MNGKDDDRCLNQWPETTGDFDSINARQPNIEDDDIGLHNGNSPENLFTVACLLNVVSPCGQPSTENLAKWRFVINYQNRWAVHVPSIQTGNCNDTPQYNPDSSR